MNEVLYQNATTTLSALTLGLIVIGFIGMAAGALIFWVSRKLFK